MSDESMTCPHCRVAFHDSRRDWVLGVWTSPYKTYVTGPYAVHERMCPVCKRLILHLVTISPTNPPHPQPYREKESVLIWPKACTREPCPAEVPAGIAEDYSEACLVLADSPKAAAALARRCLQNVLREAAKAKPSDLSKEIDEVLAGGTLPSHIAKAIDAVRNIGNFAAHPLKSQHSGAILPVEPGEADWTLNVLESLFDFYYVQPAALKVKQQALNQKLAQAGKPPMKGTTV